MDTFLPAKFSMNPFFVRHVAKPKRLVHIEGLHRAPICAVFDDGHYSINGQPSNFPPNNYDDSLLKSDNKRREKLQPPGGRFQPHGLIENTEKWRDELNRLAISVGLITNNDIEIAKKQHERQKYIKSLEKNSNKRSYSSASNTLRTPNQKPTSSYSIKTSRLNEPLLTGRRTSRRSNRSSGFTSGYNKYIVNESDREVWMLKVLCQILETDNLLDIQSWLVSSNEQEKEKIRSLLEHAMKGLESTGRIEKPEVTNFEQIDESKDPLNLQNLQTTIEKISVKTPLNKEVTSRFSRHLSGSKKHLTAQGSHNYLKLPEIDEHNDVSEREKQNVDEASNSKTKELEYDNKEKEIWSEQNAAKTLDNSRLSPVLNINIFPQEKPNNINKEDGNIIVKVESPTKDYKIEELNVKLVMKDEKSKTIKKIQGDWKPDASISNE